MLGLIAPGVQHHVRDHADGMRTAWMYHADGSWARAIGRHDQPPTVYQGGPRRLWDILDDIRTQWIRDGALPIRGAHVSIITPDGVIHLNHGRWEMTIA